MSDFEEYSKDLLLSAKLFLQEAVRPEVSAARCQRYLRAAVMHTFSFLEAQLNYLSSHFKDHKNFDLLERSLLSEREVVLDKGEFKLTGKEKFYRIEDRIEFLIVRFSGKREFIKEEWNSDLARAIKLRNRLVHPRDVHNIEASDVESCITAVIRCLSALYKSIFTREFPLLALGLDTGPVADA